MPEKRKPAAPRKPEWPFLAEATPEEQLKSLRDHYEHGGPHINFTNSYIAKVGSAAFRKSAVRKLN